MKDFLFDTVIMIEWNFLLRSLFSALLRFALTLSCAPLLLNKGPLPPQFPFQKYRYSSPLPPSKSGTVHADQSAALYYSLPPWRGVAVLWAA